MRAWMRVRYKDVEWNMSNECTRTIPEQWHIVVNREWIEWKANNGIMVIIYFISGKLPFYFAQNDRIESI